MRALNPFIFSSKGRLVIPGFSPLLFEEGVRGWSTIGWGIQSAAADYVGAQTPIESNALHSRLIRLRRNAGPQPFYFFIKRASCHSRFVPPPLRGGG